jgi:hypothetical protein
MKLERCKPPKTRTIKCAISEFIGVDYGLDGEERTPGTQLGRKVPKHERIKEIILSWKN